MCLSQENVGVALEDSAVEYHVKDDRSVNSAAACCRHVRAYRKAGAAEGAINYYRAAMRGHWAPAPDAPRPIRVELPIDLIWGELDRYLRKELAMIPKAVAPNAVVKRLPHVSSSHKSPETLVTIPSLH